MALHQDLDRQLFPVAGKPEIEEDIVQTFEEFSLPEGGLMLFAECEPDVPLENMDSICTVLEKVHAPGAGRLNTKTRAGTPSMTELFRPDPEEPQMSGDQFNQTEAYHRFLAHFGLGHGDRSRDRLIRLATAFSRLPFENLTKIIRLEQEGNRARARRMPGRVIAEHVASGTGGTCFALTTAFLYILRCAGWEAEPILADRTYGQNTHSALLVWIDRIPHLLDPGYLVVDPIPLVSHDDTVIEREINDLILTPSDAGNRLELHTRRNGQTRYRLTFKTDPVDMQEFCRAWEDSFDNEMMRYPVASRVSSGQQLYLQRDNYVLKDRATSRRIRLDRHGQIVTLQSQFGVDPEISRKALEILRNHGEID